MTEAPVSTPWSLIVLVYQIDAGYSDAPDNAKFTNVKELVYQERRRGRRSMPETKGKLT